MAKRSIEEISADQEKLVANVLVDLLGRDHKALQSDKVPKPFIGKIPLDVNAIPCDVTGVGFSNPGSALKLYEFLVECTGQKRLIVNDFKSSSSGYEAEVVFPCNSVKNLMKWVTSFEEAIHCPFRATRVENVPATSRLNAFKGKRKCACKRNVIDNKGIQEDELCNAVIRMALRKTGFAHVYLFMEHNHGLSDFGMTKNCRPQLTRSQKRMMIDLFQAGLTPVEVIDHLNTFVPCRDIFPSCTAKSCVNQVKGSLGFSYSNVHNDVSYRQVYHLFHKFKEESEMNFNIEQLRVRLDAEIDQFRRRTMRSPKLIASTLCFFNIVNDKCDQAVSDILVNCVKRKVNNSSQMKKSDGISSNNSIKNNSISHLKDVSHSYHKSENVILEGTIDPEDFEEEIIVDDLPPCEEPDLSERPFYATENSKSNLKGPQSQTANVLTSQKIGADTNKIPVLKLHKKIENWNYNPPASQVDTTEASLYSESLTESPSLLLDVSDSERIPFSVERSASLPVTSSPMVPLVSSANTLSQTSNVSLVNSHNPGTSSNDSVLHIFQDPTSKAGASRKEDGSSFPDVFCTPTNGAKPSMLDISLEPVCSASSVDALESSFSLEDLFRTPRGLKFKATAEATSTEESPLTGLLNSSNHANSIFVSTGRANGSEGQIADRHMKVSLGIESQNSNFPQPPLACVKNEFDINAFRTNGSGYLEHIDPFAFDNVYVESEIEIE